MSGDGSAELGIAELCLLQTRLGVLTSGSPHVHIFASCVPFLYCEFSEAIPFIKSHRFHSEELMIRARFPIPLQLCISQTPYAFKLSIFTSEAKEPVEDDFLGEQLDYTSVDSITVTWTKWLLPLRVHWE